MFVVGLNPVIMTKHSFRGVLFFVANASMLIIFANLEYFYIYLPTNDIHRSLILSRSQDVISILGENSVFDMYLDYPVACEQSILRTLLEIVLSNSNSAI